MINPKLRDPLNDQLCQAVLSLENMEECYQFFEDICTISEWKSMAQRLGFIMNVILPYIF